MYIEAYCIGAAFKAGQDFCELAATENTIASPKRPFPKWKRPFDLCAYRAGSDLRKIVLTVAFAVNICGTTMQSAAKGIGISQVDLDHFHAQLVHLFCLIDL